MADLQICKIALNNVYNTCRHIEEVQDKINQLMWDRAVVLQIQPDNMKIFLVLFSGLDLVPD